MTIHFNTAGAERKKLAARIAEYEGVKAQYLGAPSFAYAAGRCMIQKDGTVEVDGIDGGLLDFLEGLGGIPDENVAPAASADDENAMPDRLCISLPAEDMTPRQIENVFGIIESKQTLLKKAIGVDDLPITLEDGKLRFDWFPLGTTPEENQAYMALVCGIRKLAMELNRVNKTEVKAPNEKYAFRCFLLRLGMIGNDSKAYRRVLLKNLSGSSAWRDGRKDGEEHE